MAIAVEHHARRTVNENAQMLVPWILLASYGYYQQERPLVSDELYDEWCRRLHRTWWRVSHRHKELIARGETTCHVILSEEQYPSIVVGAYFELQRRGQSEPSTRRRRRRRR